VKKKQLIALLVSFSLVLALILSACAQQGGTTPTGTTAGTAQDKVYKVQNPQGIYIPVETHALAPRLDTLAGKNIYYYESEANPVIMPVLLKKLKQDYPTATWKYYETQGWGTDTPTEDDLKGVDAVIRGIGW
jgi:ABC-type oligopeptide transport system substrate-binding subunit